MMLAQTFNGQSVAGWWLSEKLDGCRAFWDGSCLRTRDSWLPILAPASVVSRLPKGIALDGELWAGYGTLNAVSGLVRRKTLDAAEWTRLGVRYMVFDAPNTDSEAFESRQAVARKLALGEMVGFVEQRKVSGAAEATTEMRRIVAAGGEGVVLRRPGHFYAFGRSRDMLKMKPGEGA